MKFFILLIVIFFVIVLFRVVSNFKSKNNNLKNKSEKIVDLEKDPKTDEYKPKE